MYFTYQFDDLLTASELRDPKSYYVVSRDGKNPGFFQNPDSISNPGFDLNYSGFSGSYWFPIKLPVF